LSSFVFTVNLNRYSNSFRSVSGSGTTLFVCDMICINGGCVNFCLQCDEIPLSCRIFHVVSFVFVFVEQIRPVSRARTNCYYSSSEPVSDEEDEL